MCWQIMLPDAGAPGLFQDLTDFVHRKELGNDAEADVVGNAAMRLPAGKDATVRVILKGPPPQNRLAQ